MPPPPALVAALLSGRSRRLRRGLGRWLRPGPARLELYHEVDEPHGLALVAALPAVCASTGARLVPVVVPSPDASLDPEPERRRAWADADATALALAHGLPAPAPRGGPSAGPSDPRLRAAAERVLMVERPAAPWLALAARLGDAVRRGAAEEVAAVEASEGAVDAAEHGRRLASNAARATRGAHRGGVVVLDGEAFWGLDRLPRLVEALTARDLDAARVVLPERHAPDAPAPAGPVALEHFHSLRSPYAYLALDRVAALVARGDVEHRLRPVLPMVRRGLAVPRAKRLAIVLDAAREAEALGVPFGRIVDPLGPGLERALAALIGLAVPQGRGLELALSFGRGAWAEGLDLARDRDFDLMLARAGLDPVAARRAVDDPAWRDEAEANRAALLEAGLWGVPSFRVWHGDCLALATWGQDRLWRVEAALGRSPGAVR